MLANTRGSLQSCSTSGRAHTSSRSSRGRCRHLRTAAKQDTYCKDVVNIKKEVKSEGVARVSFLGAGGHEIQIDCPKVGATYTPFAKTHFLVNTSCLLTLPWAEQDTYILEAGLQNDVELPYTCRGGICGYDFLLPCICRGWDPPCLDRNFAMPRGAELRFGHHGLLQGLCGPCLRGRGRHVGREGQPLRVHPALALPQECFFPPWCSTCTVHALWRFVLTRPSVTQQLCKASRPER